MGNITSPFCSGEASPLVLDAVEIGFLLMFCLVVSVVDSSLYKVQECKKFALGFFFGKNFGAKRIMSSRNSRGNCPIRLT